LLFDVRSQCLVEWLSGDRYYLDVDFLGGAIHLERRDTLFVQHVDALGQRFIGTGVERAFERFVALIAALDAGHAHEARQEQGGDGGGAKECEASARHRPRMLTRLLAPRYTGAPAARTVWNRLQTRRLQLRVHRVVFAALVRLQRFAAGC